MGWSAAECHWYEKLMLAKFKFGDLATIRQFRQI